MDSPDSFLKASNRDAKTIWVCGHADPTRSLMGVLGEMTNTAQLGYLCEKQGYRISRTDDLFSLLGDDLEPLARMNYELAEANHAVVEETSLPQSQSILKRVSEHNAGLGWILSWSWNLAALLALGIHKVRPTVAKLYVHHPNEIVLSSLYQPLCLLVTESILGNQRGMQYGIPPWKMVHLPHHYPECCESLSHDRSHIERLARKANKKLGKNTMVIGCVSRLAYGKNCEYALEVVQDLLSEGHEILFILKGSFPARTSYPIYQKWLAGHLERLKGEPWLIWDPAPTPYPDVLSLYAGFDLCLHLSGAESASNTVVEYLGLGKPVVLLNGSTNPYLFSQGACFVKTQPMMRQADLPFHVPDREDLRKKVSALIHDRKGRDALGESAKKAARKRFHPERSAERFSIISETVHDHSSKMKKKIVQLMEEDKKIYLEPV